MVRGPKGEYRPADPLRSGMLVMRVAVGDLTEQDVRKVAKRHKPKHKRKRVVRSRSKRP